MNDASKKMNSIAKIKPVWLLPLIILVAFFSGYLLHSPETLDESEHVHSESPESETIWTCSMHPQIRKKEKGQCPLCGMDLIPATTGDDDNGPWELTLSKKAQKLASIQETTVERRYVAHEVRVVGKVAPNEQLIGNITARFPGRIDRLYVDFAGTSVRKDDHLVSIYSPELVTAQKELLEAVKSQKNGPKSLRKAAASRVAAIREKLRLWNLSKAQIQDIEKRGQPIDHIVVYAPMKGIVLSKHAVEGDYVKTGTPIYTISDLSKIWVKLDIYESDLKWVRIGQSTDFSVEAYPGETFKGKIVFIDPIMNQQTRTIRVRINVPNPQMKLKPGMFVRAVIYAKLGQSGGLFVPELIGKWMCPMHPEEVNDKKGSCSICGMDLESTESLGYITSESTATDAPLIIPASAALITGTRAVVYVAVPGKPGTYQGRQIVLGPRAGDFYTVLSGLKEGERVVTNGAFKIDSELQIQAKTSMMYAAEENEENILFEAFTPDHDFIEAAKPILNNYLDIPKSLSEDSYSEMGRASVALIDQFKKLKKQKLTPKELFFWENLEKEIIRLLGGMSRAADIDIARTLFATLDQNMVQLIKRFGLAENQNVVLFHCPMAFDNKGAYWLQSGTTPANPYFGAQMLTCYDTKEVLSGEKETQTEDIDNQAESDTERLTLPKTYTQKLSLLFDTYFRLQSALAEDNSDDANKQFTLLSSSLKGLKMSELNSNSHMAWMSWEGKLKQVIALPDEKQEIKQIRAVFEPLSTILYEATRQFKFPFSGQIFRFHCPMAFNNKGADWLQNGRTLKNPYYGNSMLSCGSLKETLDGAN